MSRWIRGTIIAAIVSAILNAILYFIGNALDVSFLAAQPDGQTGAISLVMVIIASIIGVLIAGIVYAVLGQADDTYMWVAAIAAFLSLLGPYFQASDNGTFVLLSLMHIVAALVTVYQLTLHGRGYNLAPEVQV